MLESLWAARDATLREGEFHVRLTIKSQPVRSPGQCDREGTTVDIAAALATGQWMIKGRRDRAGHTTATIWGEAGKAREARADASTLTVGDQSFPSAGIQLDVGRELLLHPNLIAWSRATRPADYSDLDPIKIHGKVPVAELRAWVGRHASGEVTTILNHTGPLKFTAHLLKGRYVGDLIQTTVTGCRVAASLTAESGYPDPADRFGTDE
jgi:hypothetical protein